MCQFSFKHLVLCQNNHCDKMWNRMTLMTKCNLTICSISIWVMTVPRFFFFSTKKWENIICSIRQYFTLFLFDEVLYFFLVQSFRWSCTLLFFQRRIFFWRNCINTSIYLQLALLLFPFPYLFLPCFLFFHFPYNQTRY